MSRTKLTLLLAGLGLWLCTPACSSLDEGSTSSTTSSSATTTSSTQSVESASQPSSAPAGTSTVQVKGNSPARAPQNSQSTQNDPARADLATVSVAFPTGNRSSSALLLEKAQPREVRAKQPFEYVISVTNLTDVTLNDVVVRDQLPAGMRINNSSPQAESGKDDATVWTIGTLNPRESRAIRVAATAPEVGALDSCATVSYSPGLCSQIQVVQPKLTVAVSAPASATTCQTIPIRVTVTNSGTGTVRNVRIASELPAGLEGSDGANTVTLEAGHLTAGQSREFTTNVRATRTGAFESTATAQAEGDLTAKSEAAAIAVGEPTLTVTTSAPEQVFLGRPMTYEVTVENTGNAPAANTTIELAIPEGLRVESTTDEGKSSGRLVTWSLATLAPDDSRTVAVNFSGGAPGLFATTATVKAECARPQTAAAQVRLAGIPAIRLEVVDDNDPLPVGDNVVYDIRVTNQGTAPATNVQIVAGLEDSMAFVSATGTTNGTAQERTVTFAPVARLEPKDVARWQLTVRAIDDGDVRLSLKMISDQLERSVDETEATHFYR